MTDKTPIEAREGTILFGGIDATKFTPPLLAVPILAPDLLYIIELTSLSIGVRGPHDSLKSFDVPQPLRVFLDSGSETIVRFEYRISKQSRYPLLTVAFSSSRPT